MGVTVWGLQPFVVKSSKWDVVRFFPWDDVNSFAPLIGQVVPILDLINRISYLAKYVAEFAKPKGWVIKDVYWTYILWLKRKTYLTDFWSKFEYYAKSGGWVSVKILMYIWRKTWKESIYDWPLNWPALTNTTTRI